MPRTVVIVGVSGFIGKNLESGFLDAGYHVIGLRRGTVNRTVVVSPRCQHFWLVAPFDVDSLTNVFQSADVVVHAAGVAHRADSAEIVRECELGNVGLTELIVAACRAAGARRLIFISSASVGIMSDRSVYADSKRLAECSIQGGLADSTIDWVCVRPPMVYGPSAPGNFRRIVRIVASPIPIPFPALRNRRSAVSIWNLVDFVVMLTARPDQLRLSVGVADGPPTPMADFIRELGRAFDKRVVLWPVPVAVVRMLGWLIGRYDEVRRLTENVEIDLDYVRVRFGWQPRLSLQDALRRVAVAESTRSRSVTDR